MKYISLILIILLASCSLPKDLRRLKRGSKKLQKLTLKYPELKNDRTIYDTVEVISVEYVYKTLIETDTTIIYTDSGTIITIHPQEHFEYEKDGVKVSLDWINGEYEFTIESKADTIFIPIETVVEVITPAKIVKAPLSWWQKLRMDLGVAFLIILVLLILIIILKIMGKISFPFLR